jgi:hypothetical protein
MKNTKTIINLLFAIIILTQTVQAQETAKKGKSLTMPLPDTYKGKTKSINQNSNEVEDVGIGTTWDIGRKSRNCGGFGLCKCSSITFEYSARKKTRENSFHSTISLNTDNVLLSRVDQLSERIINKYFGGSQIILEEDFIIDELDILKKLGIETYTIKKGTYKLKYNEKIRMYEVAFKL